MKEERSGRRKAEENRLAVLSSSVFAGKVLISTGLGGNHKSPV